MAIAEISTALRPHDGRQGFFVLCDRTMRIQIYDTTLRDGSQGEGVNFSLQDKLLITQRLDSLGFDFVEGGYPLSNEKDAQYFQRVLCAEPEARPGVRVRHDAAQGSRGRRRSGHAGAARLGRQIDHAGRQDVRLSCHARCCASRWKKTWR